MSAELMQKAFEISKSDPRLTPSDKLVLMRWAWTTRDGATPQKIGIRPFARELGLNKSTVERSVKRLLECGYLMLHSVEVVAGHAFQTSAESGQKTQNTVSAKSGQGVRKKRTERPQKADTNKKREIEKAQAVAFRDLSDWQKAELRKGNALFVKSQLRWIEPRGAEYESLCAELAQERLAER